MLCVAEKERKAEPSSLLSQWWTLGAILRDKRTSGRHAKAAWVIIDRFVRSKGNGRASLRYIERATGLGRPAVARACRELMEWGYVDRRVGSGTRPSEYAPNWVLTISGMTSRTSRQIDNSGVETVTSCGVEMHTTIAASGVDSQTESYLPSPAYSPADGIVTTVSASGPGAEAAPAVAGIDFEHCWRAYGRYGNKQASRKAFEAIENPDVDLIARRASAWAASAKPGQRRMPFEKWLEAEKYDEADRQVQPKARVSKPEVRERTDADHANESARAARSIERKAIDVGVPLNVPVTVVSDAVESNDGDKWLRLLTDKGSIGMLIEANSCDLQRAGQMHFAQLTDACGLVDVSDGAAFHGMRFMVTHDGIVSTPAVLH